MCARLKMQLTEDSSSLRNGIQIHSHKSPLEVVYNWQIIQISQTQTLADQLTRSAGMLAPVGVVSLATCICMESSSEGPGEKKILSNVLNLDCIA